VIQNSLARLSWSPAPRGQPAVGQHELAALLRDAAATVRKTITGMQSLLVDIYPPNVRSAGLVPSLDDLATCLRAAYVSDGARVPAGHLRHAVAKHVTITVFRRADATVLALHDDGIGSSSPNCSGLASRGWD
jgi:hypothetical protein